MTIRFIISILLGMFLLNPSAQANSGKIYIKVGEAKVKKSLLALPSFLYYGSATNQSNINAGQQLFKIVSNDLATSSFFTFIKPAAFLENPSETGLKPKAVDPKGFDFNKWKTIDTDFLIRGGYRVAGQTLKFEVYVYHIPTGKTVLAKTYEGSLSSVRTLAHTFSNDVVEALTGKKGMFRTKFVVGRSEGSKVSQKEIFVMDWDGASAKAITSHQSIALSPTWSPDGKKVAYTAYAYHKKAKTRNADLFMYELPTGKRWLVSYRKGINSGANFFPNGKSLLLTLTKDGGSNIFKMSLDGKSISQLTSGPNRSMSVEPAISPDGRKIAFSSDRGGRPTIYTMNIDGSNVDRIVSAGKYSASPSWSPDGKRIAFASQKDGHFDIYIINADKTGLKKLTAAKKRNGQWADNEDPSFSPDGRHIVFVSNRMGNNQIFIINPDGTNERQITFDRNWYFKPKWSPFLN